MVYRGKLSKACAECRSKKTRCDAARPSCGQCRRAGRQCSGYRNLQELRLVDQSTEVTTKLAKKKAPNSHSNARFHDAASPSSSSSSSKEAFEVSAACTFQTASFWLEGNASLLFFDQYINIVSGHCKTELDFVASIYGDAAPQGMLANIVMSLGLAALPKNSIDNSVSIFASQKYSLALRQTQRALQDPGLAKSDETLATVLLLCLHEMVAVDDPLTDLDRLSVHLNGSIRLVQLRGQSQMKTTHGSHMFHRICSQLSYTCLHNRKSMPSKLLKFARSVRHTMHAEELIAAELLDITARFCDLLSTASADSVGVITTFQAFVDVDRDLASWVASMTPRYNIERIAIVSPDKSFLTYQDKYSNHLAASVHARYRCIRIQTNEEIIRMAETYYETLSQAGEDVAHHYQRALAHVAELSEDICHSVPFFLGQGACRGWQEDLSERPTMYGAAAMLMPLTYASNPDRISPPMYEWVVRQIARIGEDTGIAQAKQILDMRSKESLST